MEFASRKIFDEPSSLKVSSLEKALSAPYVFVSEEESRTRDLCTDGVPATQRVSNWLVWLASASIVRSVAPGKRSLKRHEFEDVAIRRGGFGNVF